VSPRVSKKQIILDSHLRDGLTRVEAAHCAPSAMSFAIGWGPATGPLLGYIASVLREASPKFNTKTLLEPEMPEPYRTRLAMPCWSSRSDSAEQSLLKLDAIYASTKAPRTGWRALGPRFGEEGQLRRPDLGNRAFRLASGGRSRRSQAGSKCGWKLPTCLLIGWSCESLPRIP